MPLISFFISAQQSLDRSRIADFIAPLILRIYLVPVFWMAGTTKLNSIDSTIEWFGNSDWGLGLPLPGLMAWLATLTEIAGAVLLLFGLGIRWITLPLMITMVVAAAKVHWANGWLAIADPSMESAQRLNGFLDWLSTNFPDRYEFITEFGHPVILNNGIEFAVTYFAMLLALFFTGGGRYLSADYWLARRFAATTGARHAH